MFLKVALAVERQAKFATFSVDTQVQRCSNSSFTWRGWALLNTSMVRVAERVFIGASVGAVIVSCYLSRSQLMTFLWLSEETKLKYGIIRSRFMIEKLAMAGPSCV